MACCLAAAPFFAVGCFGLGCLHWTAKRCMLHGSMASEDWPDASTEDFIDVNRVCKLILSVYEDDLEKPVYADRVRVDQVVKRVTYKDAGGKCPPYMIYVDHDAKDVTFVIRGLHLASHADYAVLMNNRKGQQMFDGGYVHHGLLRVAGFLLEKEAETLKRLLAEHPGYTLTLGGHSLGSGIAALMTILLVNHPHEVGGLPRSCVTCYCFAPARCTSMNLAVRYADVIKSIVLQDDFLPRTTVPLQIIFGAALCFPCLVTLTCCKETCISQRKKLQDPRRLYVPGRCYHIVYTKYGSCKKYPAEVRTSIPVNGRFENLVCSMNATEDHSLVELEKKASEAYERMLEMEEEEKKERGSLEAPVEQSMGRLVSLRRDHGAEHDLALKRAVSLGVHNAEEPYRGPGAEVAIGEGEEEEEEQKGVPEAGGRSQHAGGNGESKEEGSAAEQNGESGGEGKEAKSGLGMEMVDLGPPETEKGSIYAEAPELAAPAGQGASGPAGAQGGGPEGRGQGLQSESSDAIQVTGRQSIGGSNGLDSFGERRRRAAQKRKEEEELIQEEQRKAELAAKAVPAMSKWDLAIQGLRTKHRKGRLPLTAPKREVPAAPLSHWQKARASLGAISGSGDKKEQELQTVV